MMERDTLEIIFYDGLENIFIYIILTMRSSSIYRKW